MKTKIINGVDVIFGTECVSIADAMRYNSHSPKYIFRQMS